jgi:acetyl-CoA decarbonylase/synthase complex subunit delta
MVEEEKGIQVSEVRLGASKSEGGTRKRTYTIGGATEMPFIEGQSGHPALIALEICDDPSFWPPVVLEYIGDLAQHTSDWARESETKFGADLVRLYLTSTKKRGYDEFETIGPLIEEVLEATGSPLIVEGSSEPAIDSEVFRRCGEAGEGERLLIGTAEADRYRSVAATALAYGHCIIAQTPIDINLAKQLNILLRETGVERDHIVIDPYTGALGYGYEYSYSVMERIRLAALKGDTDLAMPMISAAIDSFNVREVRDAEPFLKEEIAVRWEFYTQLSSLVAGADIVCVRHPRTIAMLREALSILRAEKGQKGV